MELAYAARQSGKEPPVARTQIIAEPGVPQLIVSSEFPAPRDLLFRAYVDPDLLRQWLGPRRMSMTIDRFDPRHGGTWRFIHSDEDGTGYGFRGVFHGDPSRERIVWTFESENFPGHICLETVTFGERGEMTVVSQNTVYQSVEDRDAAVASDMKEGLNESMERLDDLLGRLVAVN
jgi:uncharacterized protein YndB with AHSA1/START domain